MPLPESANGWIMLAVVGWLALRLALALILAVRLAKSLGRKRPYTLKVWLQLLTGIAVALFGAIGWRMLTEGKLAPMFACFSIFVGLIGFVVGLVFDFFVTIYVEHYIAIILVTMKSPIYVDRLMRGEPEQRIEAARALVFMGRMASSDVPQMLASIEDADAELRYFLAQAMIHVESADPGIDAAMRKALDDSDPRVRTMAACVLVKRKTADVGQVLPHLRAGLKLDAKEARDWSTEALGLLGASAAEAVPDLIARFGDTYLETYGSRLTIRSIGEAAVPALIESLASERGKIRIAAIEMLGDFGTGAYTAVPRLRAIYVDADHATKRAIAAAVKKIEK